VKESAELVALLQALMPTSLAEIDLSLARVERFLQVCGNPQRRIPPVIHVAGTNGKGSTLAFLRAILEQAGHRVHVYTSPHLVNFCERIVIAGQQVDEATLIPVLSSVLERTKHIPLTFFEATTVAAFELFARYEADFTLLEVGMGGRLDATNLVDPAVSVITPVSLDHTEFLGDSLAAIAGEKAGIIKAHRPVVIAEQQPAAMQRMTDNAIQLAAPLWRYGVEWVVHQASYQAQGRTIPLNQLALVGQHQQMNAATALATLDALGLDIPKEVTLRGLASARWPARLQRLSEGPLIKALPAGHELWLDGSHNEAGAQTIAEWANGRNVRLHVICGMVNRKDAAAFIRGVDVVADSVYLIDIPYEKSSYRAADLQAIAQRAGVAAKTAPSLQQAIASIVQETAHSPTIIMICGSLYLAGRVLEKNR